MIKVAVIFLLVAFLGLSCSDYRSMERARSEKSSGVDGFLVYLIYLAIALVPLVLILLGLDRIAKKLDKVISAFELVLYELRKQK